MENELISGETVAMVAFLLVFLSLFSGAGAVMRQLFSLPFKAAWAGAKLLFAGGAAAYWLLWRKPRATRAMWEEERTARAQWGEDFKERSPIPAGVAERYGWSAEQVAPEPALAPETTAPDDESAFFRSFGRPLGPPRSGHQ